jgi:hypothetical protein
MSMVLMSACVASGSAPMPLAASGPVAISQDGLGYIVDLQPSLTGAEMTVSAETGALAMDQGLAAKRVAEAFCAGRGAKIDRRALGRFDAGSWVFNGGCA